jgi:hypothetical protein
MTVLSAPPLGLSVLDQSPNTINFRKYQNSDALTGFFESVNIMFELLPRAPEPGFLANLMLGQRYVAQSLPTGAPPLTASFREMTPDQRTTYGAAVLKAFNNCRKTLRASFVAANPNGNSRGRAFTDGVDHTCNNWTSDLMTLPAANPSVPVDRARAMVGHSDRSGGKNTSRNAAHMSQGCTKQALMNTGGAGRFYCFAVN